MHVKSLIVNTCKCLMHTQLKDEYSIFKLLIPIVLSTSYFLCFCVSRLNEILFVPYLGYDIE